jgi:ABC-type Fe3+/spermidine/putrescine transport system ATPase subunit
VSFEGKITKNAMGCWIEFSNGSGRCALTTASATVLTDGTLAKIFTRPEDVEISSGGTNETNRVAGVVEQVAYLGDRFEYHVKAAGVLLVLLAAKKQRFKIGETIALALDPARLNVRPS